ncbi:hypothetical protein [Rosenbergiella epipactidis]|uniref:hypothetical protein n=1 Tax=Rosenbergiella epipactidis TaxID=1544694 RepID=UPI001F4FB53E|nr:hypothetical protein [Rosenbergiella epipactidis]
MHPEKEMTIGEVILSKMECGDWYSMREIIEMTEINSARVRPAASRMVAIDTLERMLDPNNCRSYLYRKIEKESELSFGVSRRLSEFNHHWRGAHAI